MQSVNEAFSAEEVDSFRQIAHGVLASWKKDFRSSIRFFTIGVSTIGGTDVIKSEGGVQSDWNKYYYFDESDYVTSLGYERELNQPIGGLTKAQADVQLDNTSGRFTPRYMGGNSELFTAIEPRKPVIINAGFNVEGVDQTLPQFVGILDKQPRVDARSRSVDLHAVDFIDYLQNRYLDRTSMFTGLRTDQVIENVLVELGFATSQYDLDAGISVIPFGLLEKGSRFSDIIQKIVQAEYGHFYQDEEGRLRFENRQHWSNFPHTDIQRIITTAQVINALAPSDDHIINVVEVKSKVRNKQPEQTIFNATLDVELGLIPANSTKEIFIDFVDPVLSLTTPTAGGTTSSFVANSVSDGSGTDLTSSISITKTTLFANAVKFEFTNGGSQSAYITNLTISGRPAKLVKEIYYREQDDSSVTAYEERPYLIENDYIADETWAQSFAGLVLSDFAEPESLQRITVRAIPELQLGDLISWQGRYWRVFGIKAQIDPSVGFVQELKLLQRTIQTYFRIGISTIGGSDKIAP